MPKITIYVPDDLKAEMDAAEKFEPNWSALAQEAFRLECGRIANRKRTRKMDTATIERLRASKERFSNAEQIDGHAAGRRWAERTAGYDQLSRVAAWEVLEDEQLSYYAYRVIFDEDNGSPRDVEDFWETLTDSRVPSDDFIRGFATGAEEVFNEVADKL